MIQNGDLGLTIHLGFGGQKDGSIQQVLVCEIQN
jgi:hypothetical protein